MSADLTAAHHPDCYPSEPAAALAFFRDLLALKVPESPGVEPENLAGIVTPHIDLRVNPGAYAAAFRPLLTQPLAETYLILGVGHHSRREWNLDRRDYRTPLGAAVCARRDWVERLTDGTARYFEPAAHRGEHSIEFPLVCLQALHRLRDAREPVRFVPVLCGGLQAFLDGGAAWEELHDFHQLARALGELWREEPAGSRWRVIVSIDGCHVGPRFDHPFRVDARFLKETAQWEERLWEQVAQGDARAFLEWMRAEGNERYFDGVGALALLLAAGGGRAKIRRTSYAQWFTRRDASAVTFSGGTVTFRA